MRIFCLILLITGILPAWAKLTLSEAVATARARSVDAAAALNELRGAYWQYRTYRAGLLPELTFTATAPVYTRSYNRYQQADGSYTFVRNGSVDASCTLSLSQSIWATGGTVSVESSLEYMRQLSGERYNSIMALPVAVKLNQPLFAANTVKWDRRIEPVRYREARARFMEASEEVAMEAVRYFFNLLMARENLLSSRQNLENAEKLLTAARAKRSMGQISENDLLQIELTQLTASSDVTADLSELRSAAMQLSSFLGCETGTDSILDPVEPGTPRACEVVFSQALELATANNPMAASIRRRQLEADYEVAKKRGEQRQITLNAQIGFSGADNAIRRAYGDLHDNAVVSVGFSIPLVDWGRRRAAVRVAESNRELTANQLRKELTDFNQNLFILVERFNNQAEQYRLACRACEIAQRRYDSMVETFLVGRISTLDLADAQQNKDQARSTMLNELYRYWYYHYQLRSVTLYDFGAGTPVETDIEEALRVTPRTEPDL